MKEETKEEYLARMRKERETGEVEQPLVEEETEVIEKRSLKERLKSLFLFLLFLLFIYMIFQVFGMLKSN